MLLSHRHKPSIGRGLPIGRRLAWDAATALSTVIALGSNRYLIGTEPVAPGFAVNHHIDPWLVVHVAGAVTALLVRPPQVRAGLRARWPAAHRVMGGVYTAGCPCGGTAALVLASGTVAGPIAGLGFAALGTAWLATTAAGIEAIRRSEVEAHRRWMIRSVSLTFAAVMLRFYLPQSDRSNEICCAPKRTYSLNAHVRRQTGNLCAKDSHTPASTNRERDKPVAGLPFPLPRAGR